MTAVRLGRTDVVKLLLDHGAEVNGREKKFGQTALMWAASHPQIVRLLLNHKADLHAVSTNGMSSCRFIDPLSAPSAQRVCHGLSKATTRAREAARMRFISQYSLETSSPHSCCWTPEWT